MQCPADTNQGEVSSNARETSRLPTLSEGTETGKNRPCSLLEKKKRGTSNGKDYCQKSWSEEVRSDRATSTWEPRNGARKMIFGRAKGREVELNTPRSEEKNERRQARFKKKKAPTSQRRRHTGGGKPQPTNDMLICKTPL